jgi:dihydrofolate reductase
MPVVVLSRRPLKIPPEIAGTVEHSSLEPRALVQSLSARGFTHAYVDGGVTIRSFLAAGLIQRLIVTRVPVILGAGIPLFGDAGQDIRLKHVRTDSFDNGLVQSEYMVDSSTAQEIR